MFLTGTNKETCDTIFSSIEVAMVFSLYHVPLVFHCMLLSLYHVLYAVCWMLLTCWCVLWTHWSVLHIPWSRTYDPCSLCLFPWWPSSKAMMIVPLPEEQANQCTGWQQGIQWCPAYHTFWIATQSGSIQQWGGNSWPDNQRLMHLCRKPILEGSKSLYPTIISSQRKYVPMFKKFIEQSGIYYPAYQEENEDSGKRISRLHNRWPRIFFSSSLNVQNVPPLLCKSYQTHPPLLAYFI